MLDKFAEIETWAVGRLRAAHPDKKLAPMLGLRFDAVRQLTETHAHLFKDAPAVAKLLDELRPLHDLRSTLAHAVLTIVSPTNGPRIALFDRADRDGEMPWLGRIALFEDDRRRIIGKVSDLANQLSQQVRAPKPER
ncbi:MAG: hypothetical protein ACJ8DZ_12525 [Allosphingosinicella sp.]